LPDQPIAESSPPSPEAVRQQLQAILGSRPFVTATRARRFLTYIVEQTLAGQTDAIKELILGIEVFDRPKDFDPKADTIGVAPSSPIRAEGGYVQARNGNPAEARKILQQLLAESRRQFVSPICFAVLYMGLGDADGAFRYLEMSREQQESWLAFARVLSIYDPIRSDPRFSALLREIGLSDEQILKNQQSNSGSYR
jgi:hypothetical protein